MQLARGYSWAGSIWNTWRGIFARRFDQNLARERLEFIFLSLFSPPTRPSIDRELEINL